MQPLTGRELTDGANMSGSERDTEADDIEATRAGAAVTTESPTRTSTTKVRSPKKKLR